MCRKTGTVLLALMISLVALSACRPIRGMTNRDMDIYERIHCYYNEMERYSATVRFTVYSNKTENTYIAEQKSAGADKCYAKTVPENGGPCVTTITNGETTKTLAEGSDYTLTAPSAETMGLLFVNRFFSDYYASEETSLAVNGTARGNSTVLETEYTPKRANCAYLSLTVNNKTLAPETLTVHDMGGNVVLKAEYTDFRYNDKTVEDSVFSTE